MNRLLNKKECQEVHQRFADLINEEFKKAGISQKKIKSRENMPKTHSTVPRGTLA